VRIGERTNVQDGCIVHVTRTGIPTVIGAEIMIGHACVIHACTLQDRCFVGMGAVVMDEAVVETGAMVAAGALVTPGKRIPAGQVWGGRPARYLRDVRPEESAEWPDLVAHYVDLAAEYRVESA
jgi:carbonic anhydrase/acetyltransferase-like protein (isoleucine patch superfamily)